MPVCGNYLFFELPKKIVLNPKDGKDSSVLLMNLDKRYFVDRASIIKELIQERYLKMYCCCKYNSVY